MTLIVILLNAILVDNFVLSKFMGICPFLGVSKKLDSAVGMGNFRNGLRHTLHISDIYVYPCSYGS